MMSYDIIEAITEYYKDEEEIVVDCLIQLAHNQDKKLAYLAQDKLEDMEYCWDCGSKLKPYTYEEHHTELDGNPTEYITELRCPNCDY